MQSLWDSVPDLTFVCLYFAPAPSHPNRAWMDAASSLRSMGWGLVPTYVGQQVIGVGSHVVTADQGKIDAQGAAPLAGNAGLDAGSVIYLDIENGGLMPANQVAYVTSWIGEVNANTDHWAGVYCSHFKTAKQVADAAAGVTDHDVATGRTGRSTADPRLSIWVLSSRGTQPARAMPRPSSGSTG
jgi:hypothetical protein